MHKKFFITSIFSIILLSYSNVYSIEEQNLKTNPLDVKDMVKDWGESYDKISDVFEKITTYRLSLNNIREKYIKQYYEIDKTPNPDWITITKKITEDTIRWTQEVIAEGVQKLGPPPVEMAVVAFGSMPRGESGIYTDLEAGFLVSEKTLEAEKYLEKLADYIAAALYVLGEHPDVGGKGYRLDEAGNSPFHPKFGMRYASETEFYLAIYKENKAYEAAYQKALDTILDQQKNIVYTTDKEKKDALNNAKYDAKLVAKEASESLFPYEGTQTFAQTPAYWEDIVSGKKVKNFYQTELGYEKIRYYLLNDKEMAQKDSTELDKIVDIIAKRLSKEEAGVTTFFPAMVRNTKYIYGSKRIYDEFTSKVNKVLAGPALNKKFKTRRDELLDYSINIMIKIPEKYPNAAELYLRGILGDKVDIKRQVYRIFEQIMTSLGFKYNVGTQNGYEIADKLKAIGILSAQSADEIKDALNFSMGLRLREQVILRQQTPEIFVSYDAFQQHANALDTEITNLENAMEKTPEVVEHFDRDVFIREDGRWERLPLRNHLNIKSGEKKLTINYDETNNEKQGIRFFLETKPEDQETDLSIKVNALNSVTGFYILDETTGEKIIPIGKTVALRTIVSSITGDQTIRIKFLQPAGHALTFYLENKYPDPKGSITIKEFMIGKENMQSLEELEALQLKISDLKFERKFLEKLNPNIENPILRAKDIELLRTKYVPLMKKYYAMYKEFSLGNLKAFNSPKNKKPS